MSPRRAVVLAIAGLVAFAIAACTLNPQPLPPGPNEATADLNDASSDAAFAPPRVSADASAGGKGDAGDAGDAAPDAAPDAPPDAD